MDEPGAESKGSRIIKRLKAWTFSIGILSCTVLGSIYMITPLLPLIILRPQLWRWMMDRLIGMWVVWPGALMEFLFGAEITICGDKIEHEEPALIIMNHRTRLDWLFFWNALYRMDPWLCTTEKISMKGILKMIPGAGWAMSSNAFIFLDRSFESDKDKLDKMVDYYSRSNNSYQLLLFPEGTDKCPRATGRSQVYAEKKGIEHYEQVLHPRSTGFVHIVRTMRRLNYIKYIYDVTIGYPEGVVQTEQELILHGLCPSKVQYHVRQIPIESVPEDDVALDRWLRELWKEKEEKLKEYYSRPAESRKFSNDAESDYQLTASSRLVRLFLTAMWIFTTLFWIVAFFQLRFIMYFSIVSLLIFFAIGKFYGGIEWMAIQFFPKSEPIDL